MSKRIRKCKTGKSIFREMATAIEFCSDKDLRPYKCEFCEQIHVTSREDSIVTKPTVLKYAKSFKKYLEHK